MLVDIHVHVHVIDIHNVYVVVYMVVYCKITALSLQIETDADSFLVTLSFAFTLLGRRMFFQHAQSGSSRRGSVAMVTYTPLWFVCEGGPNISTNKEPHLT